MKRHRSIRPSHPGEVIADGLHESGISKVDLAAALGVSRNTLYGLINQKRPSQPRWPCAWKRPSARPPRRG